MNSQASLLTQKLVLLFCGFNEKFYPWDEDLLYAVLAKSENSASDRSTLFQKNLWNNFYKPLENKKISSVLKSWSVAPGTL